MEFLLNAVALDFDLVMIFASSASRSQAKKISS